ncbi:ATP-binding cassette domain-containing protein [Actinophytocola algeriensis]|uniref:ABC-2 type transport system ATP-binding protein n=1 Tax=Actinophytocola algeriensis TaxID=1768010 RepID=A0A7W7Q095_9PSEU|nr:ATP-binding cassette domain-containing protein [Actinophytocola algeriensis]MBB4904577.1 ABC-2 type transport system ATP-binding protein [Actinophytocola algeriensis]MBE1476564.1 ABC-2 type transport system ATP-binding protein [Actinophytocola algeriensis]
MNDLMIEATGITKAFGDVTALDAVTVEVPRGSVLGLLGHNGAGKTTLVNILTTMFPPTSGTARVAGFDVARDGDEVRGRIGLTGQFASVDEQLSGVDNLVLIARLLGATRREARARADELLDLFDLTAAAKRAARTYSGGMRRRLDLAASLVGRPDVIFLDEPTTGLDPESRLGMWGIVEELVGDGTTVLLTTQYLEEADRLADAITVLSAGRVVASGTAAELKSQVGKRAVHVTLASPQDAPAAIVSLERHGLAPVLDEPRAELRTPVDTSADLAVVVRALDEVRVEVAELALTEPSLDDVYLTLAKNKAA